MYNHHRARILQALELCGIPEPSSIAEAEALAAAAERARQAIDSEPSREQILANVTVKTVAKAIDAMVAQDSRDARKAAAQAIAARSEHLRDEGIEAALHDNRTKFAETFNAAADEFTEIVRRIGPNLEATYGDNNERARARELATTLDVLAGIRDLMPNPRSELVSEGFERTTRTLVIPNMKALSSSIPVAVSNAGPSTPKWAAVLQVPGVRIHWNEYEQQQQIERDALAAQRKLAGV